MNADVLAHIVEHATVRPGIEVALLAETPVVFPHYDVPSGSTHLTAAFLGHATSSGAEDAVSHTVVVSLRMSEAHETYGLTCGDRFVDAQLTPAEGRQRCLDALGDLPGRHSLSNEMMASYGLFPKSGDCNFWHTWLLQKTPCEHAQAVLAILRDQVPDFRRQLLACYRAAAARAGTSALLQA